MYSVSDVSLNALISNNAIMDRKLEIEETSFC